ncbi:MAG: energy transducer TonB [Deltaproteobacteria bacterium]|nr:energy transducer TonB [Deltaproteobacteria bacterium]MBW2419396.1 energy transducer TonB [Deltaproteobacteria bacterium]
MALRYTITTGLALAITFGLFFLMQYLISMQAGKIEEAPGGRVIDFVRLKRESALELRKRKLPEKVEPEKPPPPPDFDMSNAPKPSSSDLAVAVPSLDTAFALSGELNLGAAPSDTDATPMVRVQPTYPPRALERGIEGWVIVEFTITPQGTVADPSVIEAEPGSMFNRAALRAIRKWKYKPKIVDGNAVARPGIRTRLTFEINE